MRTTEKENRSKETKPESTHPAIFFFAKQKEDLAGGTMAAKMSPSLGGRSGVAGTGAPEELGTGATEELGARAPEELVPDDRLLQRNQDQSQNKGGGSTTGKQENNSPTRDKGRIIILFFLILNHGNHSAI